MIAPGLNPLSTDVSPLSHPRAVFISDTHVGSPYARTERLLQFLSQIQPDYLYLVGDFIDGWELRRRWRWNSINTQILNRICELARAGCFIRYAIGNHDDFLRSHPLAQDFVRRNGIEVAEEFVHRTDDDRQLLVVHGDAFDSYEESSDFFQWVTTQGYNILLNGNGVWERWFGGSTGAVSVRVKRSIQSVVKHVAEFRCLLADHARRRHFDGVICGHIHAPEATDIGDVEYWNTGDWVENCTAIIESRDGTMTLEQIPQMGSQHMAHTHRATEHSRLEQQAALLP